VPSALFLEAKKEVLERLAADVLPNFFLSAQFGTALDRMSAGAIDPLSLSETEREALRLLDLHGSASSGSQSPGHKSPGGQSPNGVSHSHPSCEREIGSAFDNLSTSARNSCSAQGMELPLSAVVARRGYRRQTVEDAFNGEIRLEASCENSTSHKFSPLLARQPSCNHDSMVSAMQGSTGKSFPKSKPRESSLRSSLLVPPVAVPPSNRGSRRRASWPFAANS